MSMTRLMLCGAAALILCTARLSAQTGAQTGEANQAAPGPEALSLAKTLTEKTQTGRMAAMSGLSLPMARVMRMLAVGPAHADAVLHEAVMPTLADHGDELTAIQINSYATTLNVDDMKAAIAFFDSPAGKHFVHARSQLQMDNMVGVSHLIETLMPEFRTRADAVMKQHGWEKPQ